MQLAARAGRIGESATLRVTRRALELKAQGVDVVDLGAGEPDFDSPPVAVEAAQRALAEGFTRYTAATGIPELREAVASYWGGRYGAPWSPGQVVITPGAKFALFQVTLALLESGWEVVLPSPCWVSFPEQIRFAGAEPVLVAGRSDDGFRIHADAILAAIGDRTRAVLLNSPANPTGGVITAEDLRAVVEAAAEREIVVISDETYERFLYDGARHVSVAALAAEFPQTVVLVGSFSKTYAMTGWRLGYVMAPEEIVAAVAKIQSHSTSNPTAFAMKGAVAALQGAEAEIGRMIAEYQKRRDFLIPRLNQLPGVCCQPPAGAFYAFADVSGCYGDGLRGSVEMAELLLDAARVAVVPGVAFGSDDHIRISFACSREQLGRGLERMAEVLSD